MADDNPFDRVPRGPDPLPLARRDYERPAADRQREIGQLDPRMQELQRELDNLQARRNRLHEEALAQADIANPARNPLPPLLNSGDEKKASIERNVREQLNKNIFPTSIAANTEVEERKKSYKAARGEAPTLDQFRMDNLWKRAEDLGIALQRATRNVKSGVTKAALGQQAEYEALDKANRLEYEVRRRRQNYILGQPAGQGAIQYGSEQEFQVGDRVLFKTYMSERRLDGDNIEREVRIPYPDVFEGKVVKIKTDEGVRPYQTKVTVEDVNTGDTLRSAFGYMVKAPRITDQPAGFYDLPSTIKQSRSPFSFRAPSEPGSVLNEAQLNFPTQGDEFRKEKFFLNYLASDVYPDKARQLPINLFRTIGDFLGHPASKMIQDKQDLKQSIVNRNRAIEQIRQLPLVVPDVELKGVKRDREDETEEAGPKKARVGSVDSDTTVPYVGEELDDEEILLDEGQVPPAPDQ